MEINNNSAEVKKLYETVSMVSMMDRITTTISDNLLFPKFQTKEGLARFLKIIGKRVLQFVKNKQDEYYVMNPMKYVVVNSGMMDLYCKDVYLMYKYFPNYDAYILERLITSKQDIVDEHFTKTQASKEIKPICFFDEGQDVFAPVFEDVDLNNYDLNHIIEMRRDRFPDDIASISEERLASMITTAVERSLKMQQRDHHFAKASYSGSSGKICWLLPLHINASLKEEPELVMVVFKPLYSAFWQIKTVLPYDDCIKDRITATGLYSKVW